MVVSAHNVTTKRDVVKELQYVGEGDTVGTPGSFGTTPSSSSFTLVGNNSEINIQPDVQHMDVSVLGSEDVVDAVKTQSLYAFTIRYNPIDIALWKYFGTQAVEELQVQMNHCHLLTLIILMELNIISTSEEQDQQVEQCPYQGVCGIVQ